VTALLIRMDIREQITFDI